MVNFWGALFVRGGDIFSYYFLVIMFRFLKKLGLRGAKFFTATKFNFFLKNRAFFDNILLLAILYEMGFILFLAAYLTLKDFSGQPPVEKKKNEEDSSSSLTERGGRALPPTNADRDSAPSNLT